MGTGIYVQGGGEGGSGGSACIMDCHHHQCVGMTECGRRGQTGNGSCSCSFLVSFFVPFGPSARPGLWPSIGTVNYDERSAMPRKKPARCFFFFVHSTRYLFRSRFPAFPRFVPQKWGKTSRMEMTWKEVDDVISVSRLGTPLHFFILFRFLFFVLILSFGFTQ